jgi:hypothetical protein
MEKPIEASPEFGLRFSLTNGRLQVLTEISPQFGLRSSLTDSHLQIPTEASFEFDLGCSLTHGHLQMPMKFVPNSVCAHLSPMATCSY